MWSERGETRVVLWGAAVATRPVDVLFAVDDACQRIDEGMVGITGCCGALKLLAWSCAACAHITVLLVPAD